MSLYLSKDAGNYDFIKLALKLKDDWTIGRVVIVWQSFKKSKFSPNEARKRIFGQFLGDRASHKNVEGYLDKRTFLEQC